MKEKRSDTICGLVACPLCGNQVPFATINLHMDSSCRPSLAHQPFKRQRVAVSQNRENVSSPRRSHCLLPKIDSQLHDGATLATCPENDLHPYEENAQKDAAGDQSAANRLDLEDKTLLPQKPSTESFADSPRSWNHASSLDEKQTLTPDPRTCNDSSDLGGQQTQNRIDMKATKQQKHALSILMQSAAQQLPGHHLFEKFISEEEEKALIDFIESCEPSWHDSTFNGPHRGKRWGVLMDLQRRTVSKPLHDMPPILMALAQRMRTLQPLADFHPTEANANSYTPGKGDYLGPHVDDRQLSTGAIVTLSLMSSCVMTFRREKSSLGKAMVRIRLPAGSLSVLTREARYSFTHEIAKNDFQGHRRISVTFRQSALKSL